MDKKTNSAFIAQKQICNRILNDFNEMRDFNGNKEKINDFYIFSQAVIDIEYNISVLEEFLGTKISSVEFNNFCDKWNLLKAKMNVYA